MNEQWHKNTPSEICFHILKINIAFALGKSVQCTSIKETEEKLREENLKYFLIDLFHKIFAPPTLNTKESSLSENSET